MPVLRWQEILGLLSKDFKTAMITASMNNYKYIWNMKKVKNLEKKYKVLVKKQII